MCWLCNGAVRGGLRWFKVELYSSVCVWLTDLPAAGGEGLVAADEVSDLFNVQLAGFPLPPKLLHHPAIPHVVPSHLSPSLSLSLLLLVELSTSLSLPGVLGLVIGAARPFSVCGCKSYYELHPLFRAGPAHSQLRHSGN